MGNASAAVVAPAWAAAAWKSVRDLHDKAGHLQALLTCRRHEGEAQKEVPDLQPLSRYHRASRSTLINQPVAGLESRPRPPDTLLRYLFLPLLVLLVLLAPCSPCPPSTPALKSLASFAFLASPVSGIVRCWSARTLELNNFASLYRI